MAGSDVRIATGIDRSTTINACGANQNRWLYAVFSHDEDAVLIAGGPGDEPMDGSTPVQRCVDTFSHESMHEVLANVVSREVSGQYDDFVRDLEPGIYLHDYARGEDV